MQLPWIILLGPTAVGKTQALEALHSQGFPISVINADAFQVYEGMDIGTAKPKPEAFEKIPHFGFNIRKPNQSYDLGDFYQDAHQAYEQCVSAQSLPVISGGTAFYIRSLFQGLPTAPMSDKEIRDKFEQLEKSEGLEYLHGLLLKNDPERAQKIHPNDGYRIKRALEIFELSGQKPSDFKAVGKNIHSDRRFIIIGLERPKSEIDLRIEKRVDMMFDEGLIDEVNKLKALGYTKNDPGMRAIGYKEFFDFEEIKQIRERIVIHSRQYAKRQMTFFRNFENCQWIPADDISQLTNYLQDSLTNFK